MAPYIRFPLRAICLAFLLISSSKAEPISFFCKFIGSGTYGTNLFNNAQITFAIYADTMNLAASDAGGMEVSGVAVAYVDGAAYSIFSSPLTASMTAGAYTFGDIVRVSDPEYTTNDLVSFGASYFGNSVNFIRSAVPTSIGALRFSWNSQPIAVSAVRGSPQGPSILVSHNGFSGPEGSSPTLGLTVQGTPPFSVQWFKNGQPVGPNTLHYVLTNAVTADSGDYKAVVSNLWGSAQTDVKQVEVFASQPVITLQPREQGVMAKTAFTLQSAAEGSSPLGWQWYFNGEPIAGATTNQLTRTNFDDTMAGLYWAIVTNSAGSATTRVTQVDRSKIIWWGASPGMLPVRSEEVISMTGGDFHFLALRANGTVDAWGSGDYGQQVVPEGISNVVSIAAGSSHSLAVTKAGNTRFWGEFLPSLVRDVTNSARSDVAMVGQGVGAQHAIALKRDGTIIDWGGGDNSAPGLSVLPPGLTNLVSVAAGAYHALALRSDGKVLAWGARGPSTNVPASATGVVAVAAAWTYSLALRADGRIIAWGSSPPSEFTATNYVDVAVGAGIAVAVRKSGQVIAPSLGAVPREATNVAGVAMARGTIFALVGSGAPVFNTVAVDRRVAWGDNAYFRMWAVGAQPIRYQWSLNGHPLANETNSCLVVRNVQPESAGVITLTASNDFGSVTSDPMGLNLPTLEFLEIERVGQAIRVQFRAQPGQVYRLESKSDLADAVWNPVQDLEPDSNTAEFLDGATLTEKRFYRIRLL